MDEKEKDIEYLAKKLVKVKGEIASLRETQKEVEAELLETDPKFSYDYGDTLRIYGATKKVNKIDGVAVCDLYSIPPDFRDLLSSNPFKIGEIKKVDGLKDAYSVEDTGIIMVKQVNPEFMKGK